MPKKNMTPEEKKAWGEKMRAAKAAKAQERVEQPQLVEQIPEEPTVSELLKRIQELESQKFFNQPQNPQSAQLTSRGIVGTTVKYSVQPKDYPSPVDRLFEEPRLKLQNFNRTWYDVEWSVVPIRYQTKDGLWYSEPKFQVKLVVIIPDPETQEPSNKRYVFHKATFFEDPDAAIQIAAEQKIDIPEELKKDFLDEMRYLRIRDWVMESFYPPKPTQGKMNKTETVIGNRLVEVYEVNSTESETIPFGEMTKKL